MTVCNSWVNVLLMCSELFQSMEFYVFIGRLWDLLVLLSMSRKGLRTRKKGVPVGVGEAQGWNVMPSEPSSHMLQEELAYITGISYCALCDKKSFSGPKHTLNWEREPPLQTKTRCKI